MDFINRTENYKLILDTCAVPDQNIVVEQVIERVTILWFFDNWNGDFDACTNKIFLNCDIQYMLSFIWTVSGKMKDVQVEITQIDYNFAGGLKDEDVHYLSKIIKRSYTKDLSVYNINVRHTTDAPENNLKIY